MHDNKGRMKGLALGAELVGQTPFLHSQLLMHTHMHIDPLTKQNNRHSEMSACQHTKLCVQKFQSIAGKKKQPHR